MVKIEIECIRVMSDKREYEYSYYLTRSIKKIGLAKIEVFGVEILCNGLGTEYYEKKSLENITFSKDHIQRILNHLIENKVSPFHLEDIIKDNLSVYNIESFDYNTNKFYNNYISC